MKTSYALNNNPDFLPNDCTPSSGEANKYLDFVVCQQSDWLQQVWYPVLLKHPWQSNPRDEIVTLFQVHKAHLDWLCLCHQSLSQYWASQSFITTFFNWEHTKLCRTWVEWGTVNGLQAGPRQNMVMEKVTIQVRPTETVTACQDGNVFISVSNSSREYFMDHKTKCDRYRASGQNTFKFWYSWCSQELLGLTILPQSIHFSLESCHGQYVGG